MIPAELVSAFARIYTEPFHGWAWHLCGYVIVTLFVYPLTIPCVYFVIQTKIC